jgi:hypothetical protein
MIRHVIGKRICLLADQDLLEQAQKEDVCVPCVVDILRGELAWLVHLASPFLQHQCLCWKIVGPIQSADPDLSSFISEWSLCWTGFHL